MDIDLGTTEHRRQSSSVFECRRAGEQAGGDSMVLASLSVVGRRSNDLQLGSTVNTATSMHNGDFARWTIVVPDYLTTQ